MKLYYFVSCILAAGSLVVFPELSPAHGGGSGGHGGEVGVMDLGEEVLAVMDLAVMDSVGELLGVMVLAHPAQVSVGAALVRDSAGRVDLRVEVFLVEQIAVASVIAVFVGEIETFAVAGFVILIRTWSILASMASDIQITTNTTTHIGMTTMMPI